MRHVTYIDHVTAKCANRIKLDMSKAGFGVVTGTVTESSALKSENIIAFRRDDTGNIDHVIAVFHDGFNPLLSIIEPSLLTAYRVHLDNGTDYVTSMAAGVTLDEARAYFVGQELEQADGSTARAIRVEVA